VLEALGDLRGAGHPTQGQSGLASFAQDEVGGLPGGVEDLELGEVDRADAEIGPRIDDALVGNAPGGGQQAPTV
jgi:hypothetical protein